MQLLWVSQLRTKLALPFTLCIVTLRVQDSHYETWHLHNHKLQGRWSLRSCIAEVFPPVKIYECNFTKWNATLALLSLSLFLPLKPELKRWAIVSTFHKPVTKNSPHGMIAFNIILMHSEPLQHSPSGQFSLPHSSTTSLYSAFYVCKCSCEKQTWGLSHKVSAVI